MAGIMFVQFGLTSLAVARYDIWFFPPSNPGALWKSLLGLVPLTLLIIAGRGLFFIAGLSVGSPVPGAFAVASTVSVVAVGLAVLGALGLQEGASMILVSPPSALKPWSFAERTTQRPDPHQRDGWARAGDRGRFLGERGD